MGTLKKTATDIFKSTLRAMTPDKMVQRAVALKGDDIHIGGKLFCEGDKTPVYVLGAGKAAGAMAQGLQNVLGNRIRDGIIVVPSSSDRPKLNVQVFEGAHPRPDINSVASSLEMTAFARNISAEACVIFLISGGASSLLEVPADKLDLEEIRRTYDVLLKSGASIQEMNTVRMHLSAVKGGKLLEMIQARNSVSLIISDVPGDDPAYIASGPTTQTSTTKEDALNVIRKYDIEAKIPGAVMEYLAISKLIARPKLRTEHRKVMVGTSGKFARKAAHYCEKKGYSAIVAEKQYTGSTEEVSNYILKELRKKKSGKRAYIFHGESSVQVEGDGKGGRNQHLALVLAKGISRRKNTLVLSAGTDGVDGNTDVAGAFASSETITRAQKLGMDANDYLKNFNSYHFFKPLGDLIFTGPTGNNVMDFQLILIDT